MAEAFLNAFYNDKYEAYSAGTEPGELNPYVVKAMAEIGIDISKQRPKSLEEFRGQKFDYVVTVCNRAREACPFFPGKVILHKGFDDPSKFKGSEDEILEKVRRVRDQIKNWIEKTFSNKD